MRRAAAPAGVVRAMIKCRDGRWSRFPTHAALDERLSRGDLATLAQLAEYADAEGLVFPAQGTLAEARGVARSVICKHIRRLIEAGYLLIVGERDRAGGGKRVRIYQIIYRPRDRRSTDATDPVESGGEHNVVCLNGRRSEEIAAPEEAPAQMHSMQPPEAAFNAASRSCINCPSEQPIEASRASKAASKPMSTASCHRREVGGRGRSATGGASRVPARYGLVEHAPASWSDLAGRAGAADATGVVPGPTVVPFATQTARRWVSGLPSLPPSKRQRPPGMEDHDDLACLLAERRRCSIAEAEPIVAELLAELGRMGASSDEARSVVRAGLADAKYLSCGQILGELRDHVGREARKIARRRR